MFTLDFLRKQETIRKGVYGDLKIETDKERVWIDGNNYVTTEYCQDGSWQIFEDGYVAINF